MSELYWSKTGEIACKSHAPSRQDPRWELEAWEPLAADSPQLRSQCERCNRVWQTTTSPEAPTSPKTQ